jgi:hypothetical protein
MTSAIPSRAPRLGGVIVLFGVDLDIHGTIDVDAARRKAGAAEAAPAWAGQGGGSSLTDGDEGRIGGGVVHD